MLSFWVTECTYLSEPGRGTVPLTELSWQHSITRTVIVLLADPPAGSIGLQRPLGSAKNGHLISAFRRGSCKMVIRMGRRLYSDQGRYTNAYH